MSVARKAINNALDKAQSDIDPTKLDQFIKEFSAFLVAQGIALEIESVDSNLNGNLDDSLIFTINTRTEDDEPDELDNDTTNGSKPTEDLSNGYANAQNGSMLEMPANNANEEDSTDKCMYSEQDQLDNDIVREPDQPLCISSGYLSISNDSIPKNTMPIVDNLSDSYSINSYMIRDLADSEEDPDENQYNEEAFKKRDEETNILIRQQMLDMLLKDAKLCENEPITNFTDQFNSQASSEIANETLIRLNKIYPIQKLAWPHILNGKSAILLGNTDYYPHLLYLPALCHLIEAVKDEEMDMAGPKVVILEHNRQKANDILRIGTCYLGERPPSSLVYFNDGYDSIELNVRDFVKCEIFVTPPHHICISTDREKYFPKSVQRVVINNFETIPFEERQILLKTLHNIKLPYIITAKYYVEELKQLVINEPEVFVSMESHLDLYYLSAERGESRTIEILKIDAIQTSKCLQLRRKLNKIAELDSHKRVAVLCTTEDIAKHISNELSAIYHLENVLNQKPPVGSSISVLICSDDHLLELNITRVDHIIHFDLPDNFEAFSFRYSVFMRSHSILRAMDSTGSRTKTPPYASSSTVLLVPENGCEKQTILLLTLLAREYDLKLSLTLKKKLHCQLNEIVRNTNSDSLLSVGNSANFKSISHLLKCGSRHYFKSGSIPNAIRLLEKTQFCLVEILHVESPIWFGVRIHKYEDLNGNWCDWDLLKQLDAFSVRLNEFHTKSFVPVLNISDVDKNAMYVLRKGESFRRCIILDIISVPGKVPKVRVKLVDFGVLKTVASSDISRLHEDFTVFPMQSINLCIINLSPWDLCAWQDDDIIYAEKILGLNSNNEEQNRYKICVQFEMQSNLIFTSNLCSPECDYASMLISKGIARKKPSNK